MLNPPADSQLHGKRAAATAAGAALSTVAGGTAVFSGYGRFPQEGDLSWEGKGTLRSSHFINAASCPT